MEVYSIFAQLKMAEFMAGELYSYLYKKKAHQHPELGDLFRELSEEEKGHEKIIDMAKEYFLEAGDEFVKNDVAEAAIVTMIQEVKNRITTIKKKLDSFQPKDLIREIFDLENELEARHYSFYISIRNEQCKRVLNSLVTMDQAHKEKIKLFLEKYNT